MIARTLTALALLVALSGHAWASSCSSTHVPACGWRADPGVPWARATACARQGRCDGLRLRRLRSGEILIERAR